MQSTKEGITFLVLDSYGIFVGRCSFVPWIYLDYDNISFRTHNETNLSVLVIREL